MQLLQQSEAAAVRRRIMIYLVDATDGYTPEIGATVAATISKNGGAFAGGGGSVTEVGNGAYYYEASATDLDTVGMFMVRALENGVTREFMAAVQVVTWDPYRVDWALEESLATVSGVIDDILTDTADMQPRVVAIETDTNEIQGKLPTNDIADQTLLVAEHDATQATLAALNDLSIADVQTALTNQGYTTGRAPYLDELAAANIPLDLDAVLTDTADMQPRVVAIEIDTSEIQGKLPTNDIADQTLLTVEHDATQALVSGLNDITITDVETALTNQGYTTARAPYLDELAAANMPADLDAVLADTTDMQPRVVVIEIDTNEIQGKLPANYIMGSSVTTNKDDEIDAIKVITDQFVFTVANQVDANMLSVSSDGPAADNIESTYDGTGYSNSVAPAQQVQLDQLAISSSALNEIANSNSVITTGVDTAGDYTETVALDGTHWQIQDDGSGELDMYYEFQLLSDGLPVSITFTGRVNGINDDLDVYAYNWGAASGWEQIGTLDGQATSTDIVQTYNLFTSHVGISGADIGKVHIRFYSVSLTSANFYTDQIFLSYTIVNRSVGYADGAIWIDTNNGSSGQVVFINGTADNPVDTWADAIVLSSGLGIYRFRIAGGSTIQLTANSDAYAFIGAEYSLDLNGQSIAGAYIEGANVSGTSAGVNARFMDCRIGTVSLTQCGMGRCALTSDITILTAGTYLFEGCFSAVAGIATPCIDYGVGIGNTDVNFRHYSGGIEIENMGQNGTDKMSLEGDGQYILNANCIGGELAVRGNFDKTDNSSGVAIIETARYSQQQIRDSLTLANIASPAANSIDQHLDDILEDTNEIQITVSGLNDLSIADVQTALTNQGYTDARAPNLNHLDIAISSRSDFDETTDPVELLNSGGTAGINAEELISGVDIELTNNHGSGQWDGTDSDWTTSEREQIRQALGITGDKTVTSGGNLDLVLIDTNEIQGKLPINDIADQVLLTAEHDATQATLSGLNDLAIIDVQTALTNQGYTTTRAPKLDLLDIAISSRESEVNAASRAVIDLAEHDFTQTLVSGLNDLSVSDIDTQLSTVHGAGSWESGGVASGVNDWTVGEKEQIRSSLGIDGNKTSAIDGQLQDLLSFGDFIATKDI